MSSPLAARLLGPLCASLVLGGAFATPAWATRWVSAYDPGVQVKPPTMKAIDGSARGLVIDGDFSARAAAFRRTHPGYVRAEGGISQLGEVVIVEGSAETLETTPQGSNVILPAIARKVIAKYGDNFQAMTLWLTFNDAASTQAAAYEFTIKADVRGLGIDPRDMSSASGSGGTLRSILNMKKEWNQISNEDDFEQWRRGILETWGQESGHRWMVFMQFIDPRNGRKSDALLGRDCSHYHRLVDTQSSVHDGLSWTDNHDGSFTANRAAVGRYGNLDLYGMGLVPADEVPSFFFIDNVPGYTRPSCADYLGSPPPARNPIMGTRVDVSIGDVIAAEGPRRPTADELLNNQHQDYFREVQVVVTSPLEKADSPLPMKVAARVDKGRLFWERWMSEATGHRMVVCTKVSADCGDARSDVVKLVMNPEKRSPSAGMTNVEATVSNTGTQPATNLEARLLATVAGGQVETASPVGTLAPGDTRTVSFALDLRSQPCGTPVALKVATQSDQHHHRQFETALTGTESMAAADFEADAGWVVNPDQTDTAAGATWERGTPEWTEIERDKGVQPEGAHSGKGAFVTGAAAVSAGRESFLHSGRSTLESPIFDASAWHDPQLRYWVSFSGMEAGVDGTVVPSPRAHLLVQARAAQPAASAVAVDAGADGWIEVDRLENSIAAQWSERIVKLPAALAGGPVKLRFVAEDTNAMRGGVEAAIDDVEILSNLAACYAPPAQDGGCSIGGVRARSAGASLLLGALAALVARRRRRL
jgi:hypothetical protein